MAAEFVKLCWDGDLEGVQAALQSGVDVNSTDEDGQTGLMRSLLNRRTGVASLLLEQEGIDINISDNREITALHIAARYDQNSECLAMLLARTTSVNQRECDGRTPLRVAVRNNALRCVQLLLSDERTDPNIKDDYGNSPLHYAAENDQNSECLAKMLLARTTSVNQRNSCRIEFYSVFEKRTMKSESFSKAVLRFDKFYLKNRN